MRILYTAIDQQVPGTTGGSIHVAAVAQGLAALGHDVHVLTGRGQGEFPAGTVSWHSMQAPLNAPHLRLLRARAVRHHARLISPDVIVERYHNFGGEGIAAARRTNAVAVLEVNAPVVDYPGSTKRSPNTSANPRSTIPLLNFSVAEPMPLSSTFCVKYS